MKAQINPPTRWVYEAVGRQQDAAKNKRVLGQDGKPVEPLTQRQHMNRKARRIIVMGARKIPKHFANLRGRKKHQIGDSLGRYLAQRNAELFSWLFNALPRVEDE